MGAPKVTLTGLQKNKLIKLLDNPPLSPNMAATGDINPNLRVFVANFDGTENDRDDVRSLRAKGEHQTLIATFDDEFASADPNVLVSKYYKGVGTSGNVARAKLDATLGFGCVGNAERAYRDLSKAVEAWRLQNPLMQVHVHVTGFSRGAATALHFMNLVDRRGVWPVEQGHFHSRQMTKAMQPGAVKTSAVLLDTVSTGQEEALMLTLPETAVSVLHIVAGAEKRRTFALTSLGGVNDRNLISSDWSLAKGVKPPVEGTAFTPEGTFLYRRLHQIVVDGACHSDVAGSYGEGNIGRVTKFMAMNFQLSLGLPVRSRARPTLSQIQTAFAHDSRNGIFSITKLLDAADAVIGNEQKIRKTRPIKTPAWNGDLIQTTVLSLFKDGDDGTKETIASAKTRISIALEPGQSLPTEDDCKKRYRLSYKPGKDGKYKFTSRSPLFDIQPDSKGQPRILFDGRIIDDLDWEGSVVRKVINQESGYSLGLAIDYKRQMVPMTDYGQKIKFGETQGLTAKLLNNSKDPWPHESYQAIKMLNAYPYRRLDSKYDPSEDLTPAKAAGLMAACMDNAAKTLHAEFPDIGQIKIVHRWFGAAFMKGSPLYSDALDVSAMVTTLTPQGTTHLKPINVRNPAHSPVEIALQWRIENMNDALNEVRNLLREEGFDVGTKCNLVMEMQALSIQEKPAATVNMDKEIARLIEPDETTPVIYQGMATNSYADDSRDREGEIGRFMYPMH